MTRALAAIAACLVVLSATAFQSREPLKLKIGDAVSVTGPYGGDFVIMSDGAVYGKGFGRVVLEGKTWDQAQAAMRVALKKYVQPDEVFLTLKERKREVVYLVGMNGGRGPVELQPGLSLRKLLSSAPLDDNSDKIEVQVFRGGDKLCTYNVAKLLSGASGIQDQQLQPEDVITVSPEPFVRIWVTGLVAKPGPIKVPVGTDPYLAIAEAGGIRQGDQAVEGEAKIVIRRGTESVELPGSPGVGAPVFTLDAGDTITVLGPEARRITIAGEVNRPGEVITKGTHALAGAIALAGGATLAGTLENVLVLRNGDLYRVKASAEKPFEVLSGDLVYVQRNERTFIVLGEVNKPGKQTMLDGREYRLSDALAEAGGLNVKGTLRRVSLARADATGKIKVVQYNLDVYAKSGDAASNPVILPGDCILFGQPKGVTWGVVSQVLSGALLFDSLARN